MNDEGSPYVSPLKRQLEERYLTAPAAYRDLFKDAIALLDHTDPQHVRDSLPPPVLEFYQKSAIRSEALAPLIKHAHESACFIESIVLAHGLAQLALRTLFVVAWQRTVLPKALTEKQLAPYYSELSKAASVHRVTAALEAGGLIQADQAKELRWLNRVRNQAAHGVIFGEIAPEELRAFSSRSLNVATRALRASATWFSNPRPLKAVPGWGRGR